MSASEFTNHQTLRSLGEVGSVLEARSSAFGYDVRIDARGPMFVTNFVDELRYEPRKRNRASNI